MILRVAPLVFHAHESEARAQTTSSTGHGPNAPSDAAERLVSQLGRDRARGLGVAHASLPRIQTPHLLVCQDAERVVEAEHADRLAEDARASVPRIGKYDVAGDLVLKDAISRAGQARHDHPRTMSRLSRLIINAQHSEVVHTSSHHGDEQ